MRFTPVVLTAQEEALRAEVRSFLAEELLAAGAPVDAHRVADRQTAPTRRLWAWRQEWGSERHWAEAVGRQSRAGGAEGRWSRVTTGLAES